MPPPERNLISPALYAGTNITLVQNGISTIINASGGGGGGDTWREINGFRPASQGTNADDDEFRDASIDAAWVLTEVTTPAQVGTWTEDGDVLSCYLPGSDPLSQMHALTKPITGIAVGTYIETSTRRLMRLADYYHIQGLTFNDGNTTFNAAGTQVAGIFYFDPATPSTQLNFQIAHQTNFVTTVAASSTVDWQFFGPSLYMRLYYEAANTWRLDVSPDGVSWMVAIPSYSITMTPVNGGITCSTHGGFKPSIHTWEYFRVGP